MVAHRAFHSVYFQPERFAPPPAPRFRAARKVFPYSVVPGGVFDPKELTDTMRVDPVAREHYGDIRVDDLVPVRIQAPLQAYVSYRIGNNIYWTAKKLNIPRGELVLTDGRNMIRARCGNRISVRLQKRELSEQGEQTLETVFEAPIPSLAKLPPFLQPVVPPGIGGRDIETPQQSEIETTPEPTGFVMCASGILLMLGGAVWRRRSVLKARKS